MWWTNHSTELAIAVVRVGECTSAGDVEHAYRDARASPTPAAARASRSPSDSAAHTHSGARVRPDGRESGDQPAAAAFGVQRAVLPAV